MTFPIDPLWAPVALRIVLGATFIVHGLPKLKSLKGTGDFLAGIGFKPGIFWAFLLGATEFVGGIAILLGIGSRIASGLLIISMLIATLLKKFKWKVPFTKGNEAGWEWDLVLLGALIAVFILGSGNWSIDQMMGWIWG